MAESMTDQIGAVGCLVVIVVFVLMLYYTFADDPKAPQEIDSTGYISHKVESSITAQANWLVGESKVCTSYPLDALNASLNGKQEGYAFLSIQCDNGPAHNVPIKFWGAEKQPENGVAYWNCERTTDSFTCKQTGANSKRTAQDIAALKAKAESGDAKAQSDLGKSYFWGKGVPRDYSQALYWYRKAAEQGDARGQAVLGSLYDHGLGVIEDKSQAAFWYGKAADQGNAYAQFDLGLAYDKGQGVPQDYAEAYFWFDLAAAGKLDAAKAEELARERDDAASHLTPSDLSDVQDRARAWLEIKAMKEP